MNKKAEMEWMIRILIWAFVLILGGAAAYYLIKYLT